MTIVDGIIKDSQLSGIFEGGLKTSLRLVENIEFER